jgi:hypothetical protein
MDLIPVRRRALRLGYGALHGSWSRGDGTCRLPKGFESIGGSPTIACRAERASAWDLYDETLELRSCVDSCIRHSDLRATVSTRACAHVHELVAFRSSDDGSSCIGSCTSGRKTFPDVRAAAPSKLRKQPWSSSSVEQQTICGGPGRTRTCNQGIHLPRRFRRESDYLFTRELARAREGAGRSCLSLRALRQPSGSLCTFRRCTAGLAQGCHRSRDRKGSLNSSRPLRGFHREGTVCR